MMLVVVAVVVFTGDPSRVPDMLSFDVVVLTDVFDVLGCAVLVTRAVVVSMSVATFVVAVSGRCSLPSGHVTPEPHGSMLQQPVKPFAHRYCSSSVRCTLCLLLTHGMLT